jgi:hypothetical protein
MKGDKGDRYCLGKTEWRGCDGKMKQVHLGPAEGNRALSEEETFAKGPGNEG